MMLSRSLCLGLLSLTLGCSNFISSEDAEQDPNRITDVSADLLFTAVQVAGFASQEGQLSRIASIWMQQMAGTDRQYLATGQYVVTEDIVTYDMNAFYWGGGLIDIRRIIAESEAAGNREYAGIAKVWEALNMGTAASLWGDLPYSEAVGDVAHPRLDEQADIYAALQALLDEAILDLQNGAGGLPLNDFAYGGDVAAWVEAAYSLKARLYLHWAEVDPANYNAALSAAQRGISNPAQNFSSRHSTAEVEASVRSQFQRARSTYQRAGSHLIDVLQRRGDPRLALYFGLDGDAGYSGASPGEAKIDASNLSDGFLAKDASAEILTWGETRLIIAESLYKIGDESAALTELSDVRRGLEAKLGLADLSLGIADDLTGEALIDAIMEEKYIALFLNPEVWNDWKRTNRPRLLGSVAIPRRLLYSQDERVANPNVPPTSTQPLRNDNDPGDLY